jgi:hypothetical protein
VAKADVLARVRADLASGHTHVAIQRLRTLLAVIPEDLEVRSLLAAVYRSTGNSVEAGRWGFLTEDARDHELAAFAKANPDPWRRLRLLQISGDPAGLPDIAVARLVALADEAERSGAPTSWVGSYQAPQRVRGSGLPCLFTAIVVLAVGVLAIIGAVRIVAWVADL